MAYQNQHFVTKAYLREWCDPDSLQGAYVWVVSKNNRVAKMRPPKKIFSEADFYSIFQADGSRNLDFEMKLQKNETHFISIQHHKIRRHKPLDDREMIVV